MSNQAQADRKFVLTKVAKGDYLLPSNDTKTLWRIATYGDGDGPSMGLEDMPKDRQFWGLWRWPESLEGGGYVDVQAWDRWEMEAGMFVTRGEAVWAALEAA